MSSNDTLSHAYLDRDDADRLDVRGLFSSSFSASSAGLSGAFSLLSPTFPSHTASPGTLRLRA